MTDVTSLTARAWDVIVIGTGMGGGTLGRALAERGLSVLFVEKGPAGYRAEETPLDAGITDPVARQLRGFWPGQVAATVDGVESRFFAPLGSGLGGSSVFYAATLERPEPHDLDELRGKPHPTGGWPVSHAQMEPWLARAEAMFGVNGEPDPLTGAGAYSLTPPPPLEAGEIAMMDRMRARGLHPYRLHAALRHVEGCRACLGFKCPLPCKMDGRSAGVEPALATGHAALLDHCEVTRICGGDGAVSHLEMRHGGRIFTVKARAYVLAAGALASPRLLLASASAAWPQGCANESGMVGRNLMFHLNEMFAIWPRRGAPALNGPTKAIGFRDLYHAEGNRFGMVQAMGVAAREGEILHYLRVMLARSRLRRLPGLAQLARLPAALAARMLGEAQIFVGSDGGSALCGQPGDMVPRGRGDDPAGLCVPARGSGPAQAVPAADRARAAGAAAHVPDALARAELRSSLRHAALRHRSGAVRAGCRLPGAWVAQSLCGGWVLHADVDGGEPQSDDRGQRVAGGGQDRAWYGSGCV